MKEVDVAKPVVHHFLDLGYDVYQEVQVGDRGIADIVAVKGKIVAVCEVKTSLSLKLLAQAYDWERFCNVTYIATPTKWRSRKESEFIIHNLRNLGIGHIESYHEKARIDIPAKLRRNAYSSMITEKLTEQHKHFAEAGNSDGRRWTPFQQTVLELTRHVRSQPGIALQNVFSAIDHHYASDASARGAVSRLIRDGVIDSIQIKREGNRIHLYPKEGGSN